MNQLCVHCEEELKLDSESIIWNGARIHQWAVEEYGEYIDALEINQETKTKIGRETANSVERQFKIRRWCREHDRKFEGRYVEDDQGPRSFSLEVFPRIVLRYQGEDDIPEQETELRNRKRTVNKVPTSNGKVKAIFQRENCLILDEDLRFLGKGCGKETVTESTSTVAVQEKVQRL
ncbi:hypothetical protein PRZ48_005199 [Zasmidium cellare]|uniref:Uncharacterized protein n=1 Tax=Zasmidium cellare TaxID=395010 RepID=A0ABR0ET92_ZASCE|nr:hypothetical protein PRZ48_005199 [Zasmidium cellare]